MRRFPLPRGLAEGLRRSGGGESSTGALFLGLYEMKVINPATRGRTRVHARYCEGDHCCEPDGEVRVYPILSVSRAARVILCHDCWEHENRYRHERGKELGRPEHWRTRDWEAAERYQPLRSAASQSLVRQCSGHPSSLPRS